MNTIARRFVLTGVVCVSACLAATDVGVDFLFNNTSGKVRWVIIGSYKDGDGGVYSYHTSIGLAPGLKGPWPVAQYSVFRICYEEPRSRPWDMIPGEAKVHFVDREYWQRRKEQTPIPGRYTINIVK